MAYKFLPKRKMLSMLCSENLGRTQTEGKLWAKLSIQKTAFVSEEVTTDGKSHKCASILQTVFFQPFSYTSGL